MRWQLILYKELFDSLYMFQVQDVEIGVLNSYKLKKWARLN